MIIAKIYNLILQWWKFKLNNKETSWRNRGLTTSQYYKFEFQPIEINNFILSKVALAPHKKALFKI